ncbi:hypothetical protein EJ03DRAFT_347854 [Teratosphaeria nubilosa]|uniref:Uncharacterized protein n=1 Tax=Teratosphaeria nubilosa TaxID=161662 RepID=A0A6G1LLA5_9PEZI|nr:hypothetical protein EJ03DRAFT_347854 [Teratosphaeria nubilosa]
MLGFTRQRARCLVSVSSIMDEKRVEAEARDDAPCEVAELAAQTPRQKRNTIMMYLLFLAEAMVQASLSSQVALLVPPAAGQCMGVDASFLRSILECAYGRHLDQGPLRRSCTDPVIGVVYIAELFKALAVGIGGIAYYVSDDYTLGLVNFASWAALAVIAAVGVGLSWRLRDSPRVGTDIPERCLTWQSIFDSESDEERIV